MENIPNQNYQYRSTKRIWRIAFLVIFAFALVIALGVGFLIYITADPPSSIALASRYAIAASAKNATVERVVFSLDGKLIATADGREVKIWEVGTGKILQTLKTESIRVIAISPDNKLLITGDIYGNITGWEIETGNLRGNLGPKNGQVKRYVCNPEITGLAFSPDGKTIISVYRGCSSKVELWDSVTLQSLKIIEEASDIMTVAFSPNGKLVAFGENYGKVSLWDTATYTKQKTFNHGGSFNNAVRAVAFSPDSKQVASGGDNKKVNLWDVSTGRELAVFSGHDNWVLSVSFSFDGKYLVSAVRKVTEQNDDYKYDGTIIVWDVAQSKKALQISDQQISAVSFSPVDNALVTGHFDGMWRLWQIISTPKI